MYEEDFHLQSLVKNIIIIGRKIWESDMKYDTNEHGLIRKIGNIGN